MAGRAVFPGAMPLRGDQGYRGDVGAPGPQGVPGNDGAPGAPGVVQAVQGTAPVVVGGTAATPVVSMAAATAAVPGHMSAAYAAKLDGIEAGANNYTHPANHLPSIITQDVNNRFVTDAEKATWNAKQTALGFTPENVANRNANAGYVGLIGFALPVFTPAGDFAMVFNYALGTANRAIDIPNTSGMMALTSDITGGAQAGSFTTLAASGNVSIKAPPGLTKNATRRYITIAGDGDVGALQLANSLPGTSNNGNIEWHDVGNTASASTRSAYITSGSNGTTPNNKGSIIVFATKPDGAGSGGVPCLTIDANGSTFVTLPALLGYGPGAGGTVTQATSKATAVTLNKPCGVITMHNAALAAGAAVIFRLNNSLIALTDTVVCHHDGAAGTVDAYVVQVLTTGVGSVDIRVVNITAGSLSEPLTLTLSIGKVVAA